MLRTCKALQATESQRVSTAPCAISCSQEFVMAGSTPVRSTTLRSRLPLGVSYGWQATFAS